MVCIAALIGLITTVGHATARNGRLQVVKPRATSNATVKFSDAAVFEPGAQSGLDHVRGARLSAAQAYAGIADGKSLPGKLTRQYGTLTLNRNQYRPNAKPDYEFHDRPVWAFGLSNWCLPEVSGVGARHVSNSNDCTVYEFVDAATGRGLLETEVKNPA
jgi:hypothetical protein